MGKIIEGVWDCKHCGTNKIKSRYKECPNCGAPQSKDTKFYMDGKNYVSEEEAKTISRNPDWECSFCGKLNKDTDSNCQGCGALKEDSERNYFQIQKDKDAKVREEWVSKMGEYAFFNEENESYEKNQKTESFGQEKLVEKVNDSGIKNNFKDTVTNNIKKFYNGTDLTTILKLIGIGLGSIIGIIFLLWLFIPKSDTLNITELSWSRSISIEEERTVKEDDWSVPSGGRVYDTKSEIHHYDHVVDHYETVTEQKSRQVQTGTETYVSGTRDLGNGYFEEITSTRPVYSTEYYTETHQEPVYRDDPVYQTKYYYEIERWFYNRSVDTQGKNKEPYWGEVILEEKEREGSKSQVYKVVAFNKKEVKKEYTVDYNTWQNINIGDILNVKVYFGGSIKVVGENGEIINFK